MAVAEEHMVQDRQSFAMLAAVSRAGSLVHTMPFRDKRVHCIACAGFFADFRAVGCQFLRCERCEGAWVRHAVIRRLVSLMRSDAEVELMDAATPDLKGKRELVCPTCDAALVSQELEGVHVDVCASHGLWFDADELQSVLHRISGASSLH